jgi:hypothetical protein
MTKKVDVVTRMIQGKKKLIARLHRDIATENEDRDAEITKIEFRIRQASALLSALEKGTLKP